MGSRALADERHVAELISFSDPAGNPLEAFYGPELSSDPSVPALNFPWHDGVIARE